MSAQVCFCAFAGLSVCVGVLVFVYVAGPSAVKCGICDPALEVTGYCGIMCKTFMPCVVTCGK